jgi:hypothetical protein
MNQLLMALCLCSAEMAGHHDHAGHHDRHAHQDRRPCCDPSGSIPGLDGGDMSFRLINRNDPCYRGTMFDALKVTRAYRDNEAFAFHHFEGKRLQISGRLVQVRRDAVNYVVVDANGKPVAVAPAVVAIPGVYSWSDDTIEVFTALVTPDGKPPTPKLLPDGTIQPAFGLEFRFPLSKLTRPEMRCAVAALWAGQYVTLRGDCRGAIKEGDYTGIIFENAEIVP